jgi:hypothetical protein
MMRGGNETKFMTLGDEEEERGNFRNIRHPPPHSDRRRLFDQSSNGDCHSLAPLLYASSSAKKVPIANT